MDRFEFLPHTADLKMRAYGETKQELFKNALLGMFIASKPVTRFGIFDNPEIKYPLDQQQLFTLTAPDLSFLLIDFLSEALYLSDAYNQVFLDVNFTVLEDTQAQGVLYGTALERFAGVEIKAVTYHTAAVTYINNKWRADIVFDI